MAYQIFRRAGVPAEFGARLLEAFQKTGDQECLQLIARNPDATAATDALTVAELIDDEYWRARVIQSLLIADPEKGRASSAGYPREFVGAVGRQRDSSLLPIMRDLYATYSHDLEFLSLYVWALGRLGARQELAEIRKTIC